LHLLSAIETPSTASGWVFKKHFKPEKRDGVYFLAGSFFLVAAKPSFKEPFFASFRPLSLALNKIELFQRLYDVNKPFCAG
jgi:hypothetical protein